MGKYVHHFFNVHEFHQHMETTTATENMKKHGLLCIVVNVEILPGKGPLCWSQPSPLQSVGDETGSAGSSSLRKPLEYGEYVMYTCSVTWFCKSFYNILIYHNL